MPVTFRSSGGPGSPTVISERTRVRDELAGMTQDEFERATGLGQYASKSDSLGYDKQGNIAGGGEALSFNDFWRAQDVPRPILMATRAFSRGCSASILAL